MSTTGSAPPSAPSSINADGSSASAPSNAATRASPDTRNGDTTEKENVDDHTE
jgi:hypothetical protein